MSPPSSTAGDIHHRGVDPQIWRACAGASVQIPMLYSRVYYFPQGHVEHCCPPSSPLISNPPSSPYAVPCLITSIELLADPVTDEVFAHLVLQPVAQEQFISKNCSRFGDVEDTNRVTTFAKILTPSDANNGGGFSVPRYCADSIFPLLDFEADPPVQRLFITDIHGTVWDFRHIFRGTPRRHLLTTGWSKFVNNKKLIAGDSVVFMKKSPDELFMGVRRAPIGRNGGGEAGYYGGDEYNGYYNQSNGGADRQDNGIAKTFRRAGKGKLTTEAVSEAINKAAQGLPFEVVYYPTSGWSEFVVRAEDVESSRVWTPGTRVKMVMETEDSSRITWFQGVVSANYQETGPWRGSPWKQLEITWDEPETLRDVKRVNPWQVEIAANPTPLQATYPPSKRMKYPQTTGFLSGDEGEFFYSQRGLYSAAAAAAASDPSSSLFPQYTTFPAGMQGARHYEFEYFNLTGESSSSKLYTKNFFGPYLGPAEIILGTPQSETLSPESNNTYQSNGNDLVGNRGGRPKREANSIRLFGANIIPQESSESCLAESSVYEDDGCKESSDNETQLSLNQGPQSI